MEKRDKKIFVINKKNTPQHLRREQELARNAQEQFINKIGEGSGKPIEQ